VIFNIAVLFERYYNLSDVNGIPRSFAQETLIHLHRRSEFALKGRPLTKTLNNGQSTSNSDETHSGSIGATEAHGNETPLPEGLAQQTAPRSR
jgi:hypothetical protein